MTEEQLKPFSNAETFFKEASAPLEFRFPRILPVDDSDRSVCRWCLQKFDESKCLPRSIAERGYMRTRLKIADNGQELICCDNCWQGACGYPSPAATRGFGQIIPTPDVNEIPNPLLRALAKAS